MVLCVHKQGNLYCFNFLSSSHSLTSFNLYSHFNTLPNLSLNMLLIVKSNSIFPHIFIPLT